MTNNNTRTRRNRKQGRTAKPTKPANTAPALTARMVLDPSHPLHATFKRWVENRAVGNTGHVVQGGKYGGRTADSTELTVRKARKFLAAYPVYRKSVEAAKAA